MAFHTNTWTYLYWSVDLWSQKRRQIDELYLIGVRQSVFFSCKSEAKNMFYLHFVRFFSSSENSVIAWISQEVHDHDKISLWSDDFPNNILHVPKSLFQISILGPSPCLTAVTMQQLQHIVTVMCFATMPAHTGKMIAWPHLFTGIGWPWKWAHL